MASIEQLHAAVILFASNTATVVLITNENVTAARQLLLHALGTAAGSQKVHAGVETNVKVMETAAQTTTNRVCQILFWDQEEVCFLNLASLHFQRRFPQLASSEVHVLVSVAPRATQVCVIATTAVL